MSSVLRAWPVSWPEPCHMGERRLELQGLAAGSAWPQPSAINSSPSWFLRQRDWTRKKSWLECQDHRPDQAFFQIPHITLEKDPQE